MVRDQSAAPSMKIQDYHESGKGEGADGDDGSAVALENPKGRGHDPQEGEGRYGIEGPGEPAGQDQIDGGDRDRRDGG